MSRLRITLAGLLLAASGFAQSQQSDLLERFERKVAEYEAQDRAQAPPRGAILLAGDSQFYRWNTLAQDLPGYTLINRGIDSFQLEHLIQYAERLVLRYEPRVILLHVGGNDVHNGKSPERVLADFREFAGLVFARLPQARIVYSSITPGPGRWDEAPQRVATNRLIAQFARAHPNVEFIDLWNPMLDAQGRPREELWVADRVHPNHAGYRLRAKITAPLLGSPDTPR